MLFGLAVYDVAPKLDLHQHWLVPSPPSSSPPPSPSPPHFNLTLLILRLLLCFHIFLLSPPCLPCSIFSDHISGHAVFLKDKSSRLHVGLLLLLLKFQWSDDYELMQRGENIYLWPIYLNMVKGRHVILNHYMYGCQTFVENNDALLPS